MQFEELKPFLNNFIQYYYIELGNRAGGNLHLALDEGSLDELTIWYCQKYAEKNNDDFGYFIATLMRYFTEDELEKMYNDNWWGMKSKT